MAPARFYSGFNSRAFSMRPRISFSLGGPGLGCRAGLRLGKVPSGFDLFSGNPSASLSIAVNTGPGGVCT